MYDKKAAAERCKSQKDQMHSTLNEVLNSYQENPELWVDMLTFKERFYSYSPKNVMLIQSANPYSTYVGSFKKWKELGYSVNKGQHGIKIYVPVTISVFPSLGPDGELIMKRLADATPMEKARIASGEIKTHTRQSFSVGTVFDISQTNCPVEDYPKIFNMGYASQPHRVLYDSLKQFEQQHGVSVVEADLTSISLRGAYYHSSSTIAISDKLKDTQKLDTLVHEMGHSIMYNYHNTQVGEIPMPVHELEADAVSIMLQQHLGLPLTETRKQHFVEHYKLCKGLPDFQMEETIHVVSIVYNAFREQLEPSLRQLHLPEAEKGTIEGAIAEKKEEDAGLQPFAAIETDNALKDIPLKEAQQPTIPRLFDSVRSGIPVFDEKQAEESKNLRELLLQAKKEVCCQGKKNGYGRSNIHRE